MALLIFDSMIEDIAWREALKMVMSAIPKDVDDPCLLLMDSNDALPDALPDGFVPWEPFENKTLYGLQELVSDFKDSLMRFLEDSMIEIFENNISHDKAT